ncbi:MAG: type-F conjugative transfer system protein TraW [Gammaproteobacteria bacterium]|nr:type-F conjugative transfer system protein TraW [Gammaproteobacteria bacterium]
MNRVLAARHLLAAWALAVMLALGGSPAWTKDLGTLGETWPVAEPDLLAEIGSRLAEMERSGEMSRIEADAQERARRWIEEPEAAPGIAPATGWRTRRIDPSIVVSEDILGPGGEVVAAAGTRIAPFEHATLTRDVLFLDGRREAEVAWALDYARPAKIVLLAGRPLDLMRRHGRPFFFDLGARLAERFAIRATPAVLAQGYAPAFGNAPAPGSVPGRDGIAMGAGGLWLTEIPLGDAPSEKTAAALIHSTNDRRKP